MFIKQLLKISKLSPFQKRFVVLLFNIGISFAAFYLSLAIRFGNLLVGYELKSKILWPSILLIVISQTIVFLLFRIHRGIVRFSSIPDLVQIVKASSVAVLVGFFILFFAFRLEQIPRSSFFIDWFLLILGLGGGRFSYRLLADTYIFNPKERGGTKTLIVGAGVAGNQLFREIRNNPKINFDILGFVDDSLALKGKFLQGKPILGSINSLQDIVKQYEVTQILIAIPSATGKELNRIELF
jgi:FlaA1/EpsC-like NDP-sugar epimerase